MAHWVSAELPTQPAAVTRVRTQILGCVILTLAASCSDSNDPPLRGIWTWGHEVRSFCPTEGQECFWVADTDTEILDQLRSLSPSVPGEPYQGTCILVEANVDRSSERTGFAADYDGLIRITRIVGQCE